LELLPLVMSARIELLDDAKILREFRGLERRRGSSGRDRVDHPPGQHDDRANAVAGVAVLLTSAGDEDAYQRRRADAFASLPLPIMIPKPEGERWPG
jgi:hypothetical protein